MPGPSLQEEELHLDLSPGPGGHGLWRGQVVQGGLLSVPHQSPGQTVRGRLELLVRLLLQVRLPLLHVREPGQGQHWAGEGHQNLPGREDGGLSREGFQVDNLQRRESE